VDRPAVEFRSVHFTIGSNRILDNLSLSVSEGETLVLLGRSGSGKTTALKMVNGLVFPTSGDVLVEGKSTRDWDLIRLRRSIGYVIQDIGLFPHFTVAANVGLVPELENWEPQRISARADELLNQVGLDAPSFRNRYPRELSGGQKQRVGVARALAADPRILLFDEPFGALDPIIRAELQQQFLELRRVVSTTSIFVTHDVREALKLGSRIALMERGRLDVIASPDEFLQSQDKEAIAFRASL
jgi:osmoprotectant transport system ATP-binding protein